MAVLRAALACAGVLSGSQEQAQQMTRSIAAAMVGDEIVCDAERHWLGERVCCWVGGGVSAPRSTVMLMGQLDNAPDLCRELGLDAVDDHVTLAERAWQRWGDAAFQRFIGSYVCIAWDGPTQELVLAADPIGRETLFFATGPDWCAFAGHPLALAALPEIAGGIDLEHFQYWLFFQRMRQDRSFLRGVERLPPGEIVRIGRGQIKHRRFWSPGQGPAIRFRRDEEYVLAAREVLDQVVAPHLPASGSSEGGTLLAELSGGLDSAGVVATAARLAPHCQIQTVTLVAETGAIMAPVPPGRGDGDWEGAQSVAALYDNVHPQQVPSTGPHLWELDPSEACQHFFYPLLHREHHGWRNPALQTLQNTGYQRLISGGGGNLAFSHEGIEYWVDLAASGRWLPLLMSVRDRARLIEKSPGGLFRGNVVQPGLPLALRLGRRWLLGHRQPAWQEWTPLKPDVVRQAGLEKILLQSGKIRHFENSGNNRSVSLDRLERFIGKNYLRIWIARFHGLDLRMPLMDPRLIDFCLAIPPEQYMHAGVTRWLARRVLADRLPASVAWDHRRHRQCPEWLFRATRNRPSLLAALDSLTKVPAAVELLNLPYLRQLADEWLARDPAGAVTPALRWSRLQFVREVLIPGIAAGLFLAWGERHINDTPA